MSIQQESIQQEILHPCCSEENLLSPGPTVYRTENHSTMDALHTEPTRHVQSAEMCILPITPGHSYHQSPIEENDFYDASLSWQITPVHQPGSPYLHSENRSPPRLKRKRLPVKNVDYEKKPEHILLPLPTSLFLGDFDEPAKLPKKKRPFQQRRLPQQLPSSIYLPQCKTLDDSSSDDSSSLPFTTIPMKRSRAYHGVTKQEERTPFTVVTNQPFAIAESPIGLRNGL